MTGLTLEGLRAKIKDDRFQLTESEAIDLFFLLPHQVCIYWKNNTITHVDVGGLNLTFSIIY
jgi:hypothetical protein